jgi:hypothetical protein
VTQIIVKMYTVENLDSVVVYAISSSSILFQRACTYFYALNDSISFSNRITEVEYHYRTKARHFIEVGKFPASLYSNIKLLFHNGFFFY